jgi:hypothetical protein
VTDTGDDRDGPLDDAERGDTGQAGVEGELVQRPEGQVQLRPTEVPRSGVALVD